MLPWSFLHVEHYQSVNVIKLEPVVGLIARLDGGVVSG